jgi:hypothetical protein
VEVLRFLAIIAGLLALLTLPCWLLLALSSDVVLDRVEWIADRRFRLRRRRLPGRSWRDRRRFARLDRAINRATAADPAVLAGPPIERVAADLRRLCRQRREIASRSPVWFSAVQRAYDGRLRIACRELRIEEHISELTDVDLEIERLRVEGALQSAGMAVSFTDAGWRQGQR